MRKPFSALLFSISMAAAMPAIAQDDDPAADRLYFGVGAAYGEMAIDPEYSPNFEAKPYEISLNIGYNLYTWLAFEISAGNIQGAEVDGTYFYTYDEDGVLDLIQGTVDIKHNFLTASTIFNLPVTEQFWLNLSIGASRWQFTSTGWENGEKTNQPYVLKESDMDLTFRLGFQYWPYKEMSWGVNAFRHNFDSAKIDGIEVRVQYHL